VLNAEPEPPEITSVVLPAVKVLEKVTSPVLLVSFLIVSITLMVVLSPVAGSITETGIVITAFAEVPTGGGEAASNLATVAATLWSTTLTGISELEFAQITGG
jgi:hypothetical protein